MIYPRPIAVTWSLLCVLALGTACSNGGQPGAQVANQPNAQPNSAAGDEAAIRTLDSAWVRAVAAKNLDQITAYYAADGVLMAPGAPMATGTDALRKGWTGLMATPGFALTFAPNTVSVAGTMAYEVGDYQLTMNDKSGKPQTSKGKYVVIWGKQSDGSWKALVDAPTTTL